MPDSRDEKMRKAALSGDLEQAGMVALRPEPSS